MTQFLGHALIGQSACVSKLCPNYRLSLQYPALPAPSTSACISSPSIALKMDRPSAPSPSPSPQSQPTPAKDHVDLRITYLVMGNPRPPHSLGNVPLNTTILELKQKIQSELPERPTLVEQRLIYQGRPLLRNDATLRDVLRLEVMLALPTA
jgi:hypothetical protein